MIILNNANIYTADEDNPKADTIVYDGKKIVYVGNNYAGEGDVHDLNGKMIIPGIIDSHVHPGMCSKSVWHIRLPWTEDINEILNFIKTYAKEHPKEEIPFLYFEYYPTSMFDKHGPTKELLDKVVSDRPCLCQDFGEHLCWINSKMLELLEVDKNTPDPSSLEIFVRDEDGEPTGWVKEMAWLHFSEKMFNSIGWAPPEDFNIDMLKPFFKFLKESGITAMFDGFIESDDQIKSICEMDKNGELSLYYDGSVRFWNYNDLPEKIQKLREYKDLYETEHIKINTMKMFLDGTNESGNSASLHPHVNAPDCYGEIMMDTEELTKCLVLCNKENLDIHIHIVGDRAFRVGCDAVEAAQKIANIEDTPWVCQPVFAHCEIVDPEDLNRPSKLGITINWSCHWSGGYFGEEAMNYYSKEKWERMYRFNPIIKSGAHVTFSSDVVTDYELHRAYPFFGMQVAATRVDPEFPLNPEKYPDSIRPNKDECISLDNLLKGYTIEGAKQLRWDKIMGSLKKGKLANMVILDKNIFSIPIDNLKDVAVKTVIFEGRIKKGQI